MGTRGATVGFFLITSVFTAVLTESPPIVDNGKPMPPRCPKNEVYRCQNTCPPDRCITLYAAFDCIANQTCVTGCYCTKGHLRIGRNGPCVPRDQCPPIDCVNDSNARRGCGDKCGKTCGDFNSNRLCPKLPCKNDGCDCKDGYIHDTNLNECVLPKDCTKPCKSHERWSSCLMGECVAKKCEDLGKPLACPAVAMDPCPGGCICDYGYVRAKNGTCIDAKNCPSCGSDPNAQYGCGNPCGKTCASRNTNKSEIMCPQYCDVNGCDCRDGYLLDTDAKPPKCVLIKNCPKPPKKCGNDEEFYCGPSCPHSEASCSNRNPPTCFNKRCELKCFCKKGYVRNADNLCIPADKCPMECTKKHERYIDCLAGQCGPKDCDDLDRSISCPSIFGPCPGGCICEEGYLRHKGKCIKIEDCPPKPCRGNQTWMSPCNMPCPYPRCPRDDKPPPPCVELEPCYPGCQCQPGYKRNSTGHCIQASDCPKECTEEHEIYIDCLAGKCSPKDCDDLDRPIPCPSIDGPCPGGCICEEGYLRHKGKCIKIVDCPPKPCGGNQTWMSPCQMPCPYPRCPRDDKPSPPCAEIKPCYPGCQCQAGYYINSTRHCIKASDCPHVCKDPNASWKDCRDICPGTCQNPKPICLSKSSCSPGCQCKKGFVLDDHKKCVKIESCPAPDPSSD